MFPLSTLMPNQIFRVLELPLREPLSPLSVLAVSIVVVFCQSLVAVVPRVNRSQEIAHNDSQPFPSQASARSPSGSITASDALRGIPGGILVQGCE
jgi:hypothetical protein